MTSTRTLSGRTVLVLPIAGPVLSAADDGLAGLACFGAAYRQAGALQPLWVIARRRTLTVRTFFAILAGPELGEDRDAIAAQLHVVREKLRRLAKVIATPLSPGTHTMRVAAPRRMKSLGREALMCNWEQA